MSAPLRLLRERAIHAERYKVLRHELDFEGGLAGFTPEELPEFEELRQEFLNGEHVTEGMTEDKLAEITAQRIKRMQENVETGKPPFQPESSFWEWDKETREFRWTNQESPKRAFGLTWKPEFVEGPNPLAEHLRGSPLPIR